MDLVHIIVIVLAAIANLYAGICDFTRPKWMLANMNRLDVPERWLPTLGVLKILGSLGLFVGVRIPQIGVAAAAGLVMFFVGAIVIAIRARWYAHLPFPLVWLALAMGAYLSCLRAG